MTHLIKTETIDKLIIMLNQQFDALETLRRAHHDVDLSVEHLTIADHFKVDKYAQLTEGLHSTECITARSKFLTYYGTKLTSEARSSLSNHTFHIYQGLDQVRQITFAQAFGLNGHPRPGYLTSVIELWQFVVTLDPTKKDLIPATLKDYARHLLYTLGTLQSTGITRPRNKRSRSLARSNFFDNTNVVTAASPAATPILGMAALNIGTSQTAVTSRPKKKKSRSQVGLRLFDNTNVVTAESSAATPMLSMVARINNCR